MSKPTEQPETNGDASAGGERASGRGVTKRARKPQEWKWHIYQLPEDVDEKKRFVVSLPFDADPEQFIETNEPAGIYRIEKKRGGEFSEAWKYRWNGEQEEPLDDEEFPTINTRSDPEPTASGNGFDEEKLARLVSSVVNATIAARERVQATRTNGTPDPMEQFRQMRELLKDERAEMREEMRSLLPKVSESAKVNPQPETLTIEKAILHLVSQDENAIQNVANRILGSGQEQSNWSTVFKPLLNSIGQNLPVVLSTVAAAARAQQQPASTPIQPNAPQPPTPVQNPTPEPTAAPTPVPTSQSTPQTDAPPCAPASDEASDDKPLTVVEVLENLFGDMHKAAPVSECAEELITFAKDNPDYVETIESLMTSPPEAVLQMLDQATSNTMKEITGAMHAPAWIGKLQLEMQRLKGTMTNSETVKA